MLNFAWFMLLLLTCRTEEFTYRKGLAGLTHHNTDPDSVCDEAEKIVHADADAGDDNAENSSNNEDDTDNHRVVILKMRVD